MRTLLTAFLALAALGAQAAEPKVFRYAFEVAEKGCARHGGHGDAA